MGTVWHLAEVIECRLRRAYPKLRKALIRKLAATVAAALPIGTERADMRSQWIARLLANERVERAPIVEPFARKRLRGATSRVPLGLLALAVAGWVYLVYMAWGSYVLLIGPR